MDPVTMGLYVQLGFTAFRLGTDAYTQIKAIYRAHGLTDEDIDKIEAGVQAEAEARGLNREGMAKKDGGE